MLRGCKLLVAFAVAFILGIALVFVAMVLIGSWVGRPE